ncbi:MAG: Peptidase protein, partial [Candidatus Hydrogenedentes bacterium]|nr:Peptidase protein [Candidatus Hydrogenedentota bacterium]
MRKEIRVKCLAIVIGVVFGAVLTGAGATASPGGLCGSANVSGAAPIVDRPDPSAFRELTRRQHDIEAGKAATGKTSGVGRVLVILVEFGGTDKFTFTPGESPWDPFGRADLAEDTGETCDCTNII